MYKKAFRILVSVALLLAATGSLPPSYLRNAIRYGHPGIDDYRYLPTGKLRQEIQYHGRCTGIKTSNNYRTRH
jgi:hypothetical protein